MQEEVKPQKLYELFAKAKKVEIKPEKVK